MSPPTLNPSRVRALLAGNAAVAAILPKPSPAVAQERERLLAKAYGPKAAPSAEDVARKAARLKKSSAEGKRKYVIYSRDLAGVSK